MADDSEDSASPQDPQDAGKPSSGGVTVHQVRPSRVSYLVPAVALVVGLVVGGGFVALTGLGTGSGSAEQTGPGGETSGTGPTSGETAVSSPGSGPSPTDIEITVPAECVQLTNDSQRLLDLVTEAAAAARDLDASRLSVVVSQLQQAQQQLQQQTDACRSAAVAGDGGSVSGSGSPDDSISPSGSPSPTPSS